MLKLQPYQTQIIPMDGSQVLADENLWDERTYLRTEGKTYMPDT